MVNKEIRESKRAVYTGVVFKCTIGLGTLENWQEKAAKYSGSPKFDKLMLKVAGNVQRGMRIIEPDYTANGSDFEQDYAALSEAVRTDVVDNPPQQEA